MTRFVASISHVLGNLVCGRILYACLVLAAIATAAIVVAPTVPGHEVMAYNGYMAPVTAQRAMPAAGDDTGTQAGELARAYVRFDVRQQAKRDIAGTLKLALGDQEASAPVSARAGAPLAAFLMIPERMGRYRLELVTNNSPKPVLWVDGELERLAEGEYRHRLIAADADSEVFTLAPDEEGVVIAMGSVRGYLAARADLRKPITGTLQLGVDANGDGTVDPARETVSLTFQGKTEVSTRMPENVLPLTSKYFARLMLGDNTVARNEGLYDFLNREGVDSAKDAKAEFIREFTVSFVRTPVATRVRILNASIRQPPVSVRVEPRTQESTDDTIRQGPEETITPTPAATPRLNPSPARPSATPPGPQNGQKGDAGGGIGRFLLNNWPTLVLVGAVSVAVALMLRSRSTPPARQS